MSGAVPDVVVIDLRGEAPVLAPHRWTPHHRREPAGYKGVVLHQWATPVGTTPENRRRFGEPAALARRGAEAPYAISCGATRSGIPVVCLAHPLERATFVSDDGNSEYLSIGVMGRFAYDDARRNARPSKYTADTAALQAAVASALDHAAAILAEALVAIGRTAPTSWALVSHRQCVNGPKDHLACPGEAVVRMALVSPAVLGGVFVPDPDLVLRPPHGRPWPASWRRHLPSAGATVIDLPIAVHAGPVSPPSPGPDVA